MNSRHRFHIFYQYIKDLSSQILEPTYIKIFTMHLLLLRQQCPQFLCSQYFLNFMTSSRSFGVITWEGAASVKGARALTFLMLLVVAWKRLEFTHPIRYLLFHTEQLISLKDHRFCFSVVFLFCFCSFSVILL